MGSSQSRPRVPGAMNGSHHNENAAANAGSSAMAAGTSSGYFIMALKGEKIKLVNVDSASLRILSSLVKKHFTVLKEGWDRQMTYSFKMANISRLRTIQFVSDLLLWLWEEGWEPMTPIDMAAKMKNEKLSTQTAVCFRRRTEKRSEFGSTSSLSALSFNSRRSTLSGVCIEIYMDNFIGFHNVPNTILYELFTTLQSEWAPGIKGISMGVASVISDYAPSLPPLLPAQQGEGSSQNSKFLQLGGSPWRGEAEGAERLQVAIIAALANSYYKLSMSIDMDTTSRVYFFIYDPEAGGEAVRIPLSYSGLGEKDSLAVYQPMVTRNKASVYNRRPSFKKIRASLRRKTLQRQDRQNAAMSYKPEGETPAWWQQKSTESSDSTQ